MSHKETGIVAAWEGDVKMESITTESIDHHKPRDSFFILALCPCQRVFRRINLRNYKRSINAITSPNEYKNKTFRQKSVMMVHIAPGHNSAH